MHPVGKPMGLSLHDLQMTAEPAAYLTDSFSWLLRLSEITWLWW
jgi:hypothetical protein